MPAPPYMQKTALFVTAPVCRVQRVTALSGTVFAKNWTSGDRALHDLYNVISTTMPQNAPGSLAEADYLSVLAFVLGRNGYAPGGRKLTTDRLGIQARFGQRPIRRAAGGQSAGLRNLSDYTR